MQDRLSKLEDLVQKQQDIIEDLWKTIVILYSLLEIEEKHRTKMSMKEIEQIHDQSEKMRLLVEHLEKQMPHLEEYQKTLREL